MTYCGAIPGWKPKGPKSTHSQGVKMRARGTYASAETLARTTKNRPGSAAPFADSRARNSPERGASRYMAAAAMLSANRNHRNHIGPLGQNGSAVQCDQNADQPGSTAVTRYTG